MKQMKEHRLYGLVLFLVILFLDVGNIFTRIGKRMIITQTPFRMSFFGGGTDMENFFKHYGGAVLSTTFDKYCYVNVRHLPRFFDYSTELSYSKTERVTSIDEIQHTDCKRAGSTKTGTCWKISLICEPDFMHI